MDNLSHAFSGLAAGELIHRCLPQESQTDQQALRRRLLLVTGALAANFPDLDLVLTPLLPEPLGYLLHHRGHTHTFLYALPQALLLAAVLALLWPSARRLLIGSRTALAGFGLVLATGFILHILMDYLNSYGVHPFHPFDSRWFYGDMIFIIEPVFWVALGIPLFMMIRRLWLRLLLIAVLAAAITYFTDHGFLTWTAFGVLAGTGLILALIQTRTGERGLAGLVAGFAAAMIFVGGQALASSEGRRMVTESLEAAEPGSRVMDVAMTPFPANPACWMFASVERNGDVYQTRRGVLSLIPERLAATDCPKPFAQIPPGLSDPYSPIAVLFTHRGDLASLQALYEQDCHFQAWMRFARVPLHQEMRARDIRFDRTDDNFTAIDLDRMSQVECPRHVPQWGVPRLDLILQDAQTSH